VFATGGSKLCPFGTYVPPHPGHLPVRPISSMEPAIHDVHILLNGWTRHAKAAAGLRQRRLYALLLRGLAERSAIDGEPIYSRLRKACRNGTIGICLGSAAARYRAERNP